MVRRILVVDDHLDVLRSTAKFLEIVGREVDTAQDGRKAVEIAVRSMPQAILLDLNMPVMDGWDACRAIRKLPGGSEAVVIAITGNDTADTARRFTAAGFDAQLQKPVRLDAVLRLVDDLFDRRSNDTH